MSVTKFKNRARFQAQIEITQQTANRVPVLNGSKELISSSITTTELDQLSGASGNLQDQITDAQADATQAISDAAAAQATANSAIPATEKGAALGVATLDAGGKVPSTQLPSYVDDVIEAADFASLPVTGEAGKIYVTLNDNMCYRWSGSAYVQITSGAVSSVFGRTGNVSAQSGDYTASQITNVPAGGIAATTVQAAIDELDLEKAAAVHTHVASDITDFSEASQDAIGASLSDTSSIDFTYDDSAGLISAEVLPAGVDHNLLSNYAANEHVDHSTVEIQTSANSGLSGGGNITTTRSLVVDITGTTAETSADGADEILIWDASANARRKMTRANFLLGSGASNTDQLPEGSTNLYFTEERAQDAVGAILTDSSSIDFTYNDGSNTISAAVLPAGVDHDALSNFVANEHVDHSSVEIATAANSGLSGGGNITATRNLSVDISGTAALGADVDAADELLVYDVSTSSLKKATRSQLLGSATTSSGDIAESSFSLANNQSSPASVTGFAFANGVVRSFEALASVQIDATGDLFEAFKITGIQKASGWDISVIATGDESLVSFSITSAGQIQYTSGDYAGFSSGSIKFRAITTSI